jgi:hypothetical protein
MNIDPSKRHEISCQLSDRDPDGIEGELGELAQRVYDALWWSGWRLRYRGLDSGDLIYNERMICKRLNIEIPAFVAALVSLRDAGYVSLLYMGEIGELDRLLEG